MKLLIVTQKVDQNDDVLGFFHGWITEFAKHFEQVTVITLGVGEHDFASNVHVFSLGKEQSISRSKYLINFYRIIWSERNHYDAVFVHMNQEYVLLGGALWKLLGKKVSMWRNHYAGSFLTRIAMMLADDIFCTSKYSFTAQSKKTTLMPVGIDMDVFKKIEEVSKKPNSILFLARIAPAKKPHLLIEALHQLRDEGVSFTADFYGNTLSRDISYLDSLKKKVKQYDLSDSIIFEQGIANKKTPRVYGAHEIFVNTSPSGMYDKTIFEAMACESLILTSNMNLRGEIHERFLFKENDSHDLAEKLKVLLALSAPEKERYSKELRVYTSERHSLSALGTKHAIILKHEKTA